MSIMSVLIINNPFGKKTDFVRASRDSSRDGITKKGYPI